MTVEVLRTKADIENARQTLRRRGISLALPRGRRVLARLGRRLGLIRTAEIGHDIKSWDVLKTVEFIEGRVRPDAPILDLGALTSEIILILQRVGYSRLCGVDLAFDLTLMPRRTGIHYAIADFMRAPFRPRRFAAITAISAIEHGFDGHALLREVSRLLCPGGFFIASFDYWPEKVDTTGVRMFGLDWQIFSESEVLTLLDEAGRCGLRPYGVVDLQAGDRAVHWGGRRYTFAWLVLERLAAG